MNRPILRLKGIFFPFLAAIAALILNSATAWPADIWKTKPVQQWTPEETRGFLLNSPWVRQVTLGSVLSGMEDSGVNAQTRPGRGEASGAERGVDTTASDMALGEGGRNAVYYIEWSSARIVRAANVHIGMLQGRIKQDPGEPPALDTYVLTVGGADLRAFSAATEPQLQATASLRAKRSKTRIGPKEVKILKRENRVVAVTFTFPRTVDGQPVIPDQEKSAEFSFKAGDVALKASFDLNKMATEAGRDL